jgi:hypothetical protein
LFSFFPALAEKEEEEEELNIVTQPLPRENLKTLKEKNRKKRPSTRGGGYM